MRYNGKNFKRVMNEAKDSKSIGMFIGIVSEFDKYFIANPDAFCNTNLRNTVFDSCSFSNMKFSDTDFVGCVIMNTVFENCAFSFLMNYIYNSRRGKMHAQTADILQEAVT